MREIFSSVEGLRLRDVIVKPVTLLPHSQQLWVRNTQRELLRSATLPESVSSKMLMELKEKPLRQAYFQIRGRSYFTDFFFPTLLLVVEIDGSAHKYKKSHDRRRDADFRSIGIRTIRIKNKDVMNGRLYNIFFKKLYR